MRAALFLLLVGCVTPIGTEEHRAAADIDRDGRVGAADCGVSDPNVHEGAVEWCNGIDDDCDGVVDGPEARGVRPFWPDGDGDGFGLALSEAVWACEAPPGHAPMDGDCADDDPAVYPDARPELCNGVDDDCNGLVDIEDPGLTDGILLYQDADQDGFGRAGTQVLGCSDDPSLSDNGDDCDDGDPDVNPGVAERCNGIDDDCDGSPGVDEVDGDGDGVRVCGGDCDDGDPAVAPGLAELCNGIDDDCSGTADDGLSLTRFYGDVDGDGYGGSAFAVDACIAPPGWLAVGGDCDDADPQRHPTAAERCNGLDDDCDGAPGADELDGDGDGVSTCQGDCDDGDPGRFPGADEVCDGVDRNCNGIPGDVAPELLPVWFYDGDLDGYGDSAVSLAGCFASAGFVSDGGDCDDSNDQVSPAALEVCGDGVDNDCDRLGCGPVGALTDSAADHFVEATFQGFPADPRELRAGDLDGDGARDLVVADPGFTSLAPQGAAWVFAGPIPAGSSELDAARTTLYGAPPTGVPTFGSGLATGDLDGDGLADLAVADETGVFVFHGPLQPGLQTSSTADAVVEGVGPALSVADLDADGVQDLAASGPGGIELFSGPLPAWTDLAGARATLDVSDALVTDFFAVSPGDLDLDGRDDLAVCSPGRDALGAGSVFLAFGAIPDGLSDLSASAVAYDGASGEAMRAVDAAGDLTGDGVADLVLVGGGPSGGVVHVIAGGWLPVGGPAAVRGDVHVTLPSWDPDTDHVALLDLNGDGVDDLAVALATAPDAAEVRVLHGPLSGSVDAADAETTVSVGAVRALLGADLSGDGVDDLVIAGVRGPPPAAPAPGLMIFFGEGL